MPRLCVDCIHYKQVSHDTYRFKHGCTRRRTGWLKLNLVTGEYDTADQPILDCTLERKTNRNEAEPRKCGPEGRYYNPKG